MLKPRRYKRVVSAGAPAPSGDPYWTSVSLLTNFENNLTFQDGSTNNIALTRVNTVNPSLNTPFSGGVGGSEYFNAATGGYLSGPNTTALQMGTGDYTVEFWMYQTNVSTTQVILEIGRPSTSGSPGFQIDTIGGAVTVYGGATTGTLLITAGSTQVVNTWYHIALTRQSSSTKLFINGTQSGSTATDSTNYNQAYLWVGANGGGGSGYVSGFISNIRALKGTALYTANFTPPTAPLTAITNTSLLITGTGQGMFNNSTFVDQGPNALTVTATGSPVYSGLSPFGNTYAGSVLLNGTSQYVTAPDNAALNMGTSDFTLEAWIYLTATPGASVNDGANVINKDGKAATSWAQYSLFVSSALKVCASFSSVPNGGGAPTAVITGTTTLALNTWYHVAVTRIGVNGTVWVNGSSNGTTTSIPATLANGARALHIGYEESQAAFAYFPGYISNLRIVKGTAVYTANFTPSTTPLTAITNTSLLVRGDTGAFYDLSNVGNPESGTGSATVTTQVKKFGNESSSFNGTNAYISVPSSTALNLSSGDWTIECWVYWTGANAGATFLDKDGVAASTYPSYQIVVNGSGFVRAAVGSGNSTAYIQILTSSTLLTANTWTFVTFVKNGTTLTLYQAGTNVASATQTGSIVDGGKALNVGYATGQPASSYMSGYLDDIRITKGVARYTANFTPPTATFPTA